MNPLAPNKLSPWVQALLAAAFVLMFGLLLFLPAWKPEFKPDADVKQNLFILVTAVVFFFIGKNTDSAAKDQQQAAITSQLVANSAPPIPAQPTEGKTP